MFQKFTRVILGLVNFRALDSRNPRTSLKSPTAVQPPPQEQAKRCTPTVKGTLSPLHTVRLPQPGGAASARPAALCQPNSS